MSWNLIEMNLKVKSEKEKNYKYFSNGSDYIEASISEWAGKTPITFTIKKSHMEREFFHANYCKEFDRLEIHYYYGKGTNKNTPSLKIEFSSHCIVNCTKVIFIEYSKSEILDRCAPDIINNPKTSKGSIIIGNP